MYLKQNYKQTIVVHERTWNNVKMLVNSIITTCMYIQIAAAWCKNELTSEYNNKQLQNILMKQLCEYNNKQIII